MLIELFITWAALSYLMLIGAGLGLVLDVMAGGFFARRCGMVCVAFGWLWFPLLVMGGGYLLFDWAARRWGLYVPDEEEW